MSSDGTSYGDGKKIQQYSTAERTDESSIKSDHKIYQTDEAITVICNAALIGSPDHFENASPPVSYNHCNDDKQCHIDANESEDRTVTSGYDSNASTSRNETTNNLWRKKTVSFENDERIKKFMSGDVIVDKMNPFRSMEQDIPEIRKISKLKKSGIPTRSPQIIQIGVSNNDETDFISKEDILKQSKYVPVYIRNPDRVLTYDKSVLESISNKTPKPQIVKRTPVPIPRKTVKKPKERKKVKPHGKYPELSEIKVCTLINCQV